MLAPILVEVQQYIQQHERESQSQGVRGGDVVQGKGEARRLGRPLVFCCLSISSRVCTSNVNNCSRENVRVSSGQRLSHQTDRQEIILGLGTPHDTGD